MWEVSGVWWRSESRAREGQGSGVVRCGTVCKMRDHGEGREE